MQVPFSEIPKQFHERIGVVHSISKPLEDLTVNDICKLSGITRKKFYSLFETKYDIMFWYVNFCASLSIAKIGIELTWEEGIITFLELLDEERSFLSADASRFESRPRSYYWSLRDKRNENIEKAIAQCGKTSITPLLRMEIETYTDLTPRFLNSWMLNDGSMSREEYARFWINCVPRTLYWALDIDGD